MGTTQYELLIIKPVEKEIADSPHSSEEQIAPLYSPSHMSTRCHLYYNYHALALHFGFVVDVCNAGRVREHAPDLNLHHQCSLLP